MNGTERAELQIALAEFSGWYDCHCLEGGNVPFGKPDDDWNDDAREFKQVLEHEERIPNYHEDLNAVHEVEKFLDEDQWNRYIVQLARVIANADDSVKVSVPASVIISATALQRSQALFRLIKRLK